MNFASSVEGTRVIVNGHKDATTTFTEVDSDNLGTVIAEKTPRPSVGLNTRNVEGCLSEIGEVSIAVGQLDNCRNEINLVDSPLVDQPPLSYEYHTSCETNTFVPNIPPKTPITNSNYTEKHARQLLMILIIF